MAEHRKQIRHIPPTPEQWEAWWSSMTRRVRVIAKPPYHRAVISDDAWLRITPSGWVVPLPAAEGHR